MANPEQLTQLKDIHLPDAVSWWPLAQGWYGVMVLLFFLVMGLVYLVYRRYEHARAKNQALVLLRVYKEHYEKERNAQLMSARISELLRRVALVYYPRVEVASLKGDDWIAFLNQTAKAIDFTPVKSMLLDSPFKTAETVDLKPLITRAQRWIKQRGVPCSN